MEREKKWSTASKWMVAAAGLTGVIGFGLIYRKYRKTHGAVDFSIDDVLPAVGAADLGLGVTEGLQATAMKPKLFEAKFVKTYGLPSIIPMLGDKRDAFLRMHRVIHDHDINGDGLTIFYGNGSTQVIGAVLYALEKVLGALTITQTSPAYMFHGDVVRVAAPRSTYALDLQGPSVNVEIICTPNNPTGELRQPKTNAKYLIVDLSYLSRNYVSDLAAISQAYQWMETARQQGRVVFPCWSLSKTTAMTGLRIGYTMLTPSMASQFLPKMLEYTSSTSLGFHPLAMDALLREIPSAENVLQSRFNADVTVNYEIIDTRAKQLISALSGLYGGSRIKPLRQNNAPYLFVKVDGISDLEAEMLRRGIITRSGTQSGATPEYVRFNLMGLESVWNSAMQKLQHP